MGNIRLNRNSSFGVTSILEREKYTPYEATQVQRQPETAMRAQKDRAIIAKAAGDMDFRRETQQKINQISDKYAKFSKAAGLPTKVERARVAGFHRVSPKARGSLNS